MRCCEVSASSIGKASIDGRGRHSLARMAGFTLVELVTVLIIVGILAVVAIPRFMDRTFDERGFHDAVKAAAQHARRVAVASRRFSCVIVSVGAGSSGIVELRRDATVPESVGTVGCTTSITGVPITLPAPGRGCATNQVCAPSGVSLLAGSSSLLIFDPLGRSVDSSKAVQGGIIKTSNQADINVQPETGYVQ
jgi:MSHA pilin protein MshC